MKAMMREPKLCSQVSFGLDLAGYSTGRSALARLEDCGDGIASVSFIRGGPFGSKINGVAKLGAVANEEADILCRCLEAGPLAVDIPIDLQGLPNIPDPAWIWQLTMRSVDYAFGGLPPFADRIGSPVARFQNIMKLLEAHLHAEGIVEAYPAASLECMGLPNKGYKGTSVVYSDGVWRMCEGSGEKTALAQIATALNLTASEQIVLTDDDLDAILCCLAGISPAEFALEGGELASEVQKRLSSKGIDASLDICQPPKGYRLLRTSPFNEIRVRDAKKEAEAAE